MKKRHLLMTTAIAGMLATATTTYVNAEEISKPKGATGSTSMTTKQARPNEFWWPDQLDLSALRDHDQRSNPMGVDFNYAEEFDKLDLGAVNKISMRC